MKRYVERNPTVAPSWGRHPDAGRKVDREAERELDGTDIRYAIERGTSGARRELERLAKTGATSDEIRKALAAIYGPGGCGGPGVPWLAYHGFGTPWIAVSWGNAGQHRAACKARALSHPKLCAFFTGKALIDLVRTVYGIAARNQGDLMAAKTVTLRKTKKKAKAAKRPPKGEQALAHVAEARDAAVNKAPAKDPALEPHYSRLRGDYVKLIEVYRDAQRDVDWWERIVEAPRFVSKLVAIEAGIETAKEKMVSAEKADLLSLQADVRARRMILETFKPEALRKPAADALKELRHFEESFAVFLNTLRESTKPEDVDLFNGYEATKPATVDAPATPAVNPGAPIREGFCPCGAQIALEDATGGLELCKACQEGVDAADLDDDQDDDVDEGDPT